MFEENKASLSLKTATSSLLIQDPARQCAYLLPSETLAQYEVTADTSFRIEAGTVTFILAQDELFHDLVDLSPCSPSTELSVLIQDPAHDASYYIPAASLRQYISSLPQTMEELPPNCVTFIVPQNDLLEELPNVRPSLLQSNTPRPTPPIKTPPRQTPPVQTPPQPKRDS